MIYDLFLEQIESRLPNTYINEWNSLCYHNFAMISSVAPGNTSIMLSVGNYKVLNLAEPDILNKTINALKTTIKSIDEFNNR